VGDGRTELNADSSSLDSDFMEISGAGLRINASARLGSVGNIHIIDRGTIDFSGGTPSTPNQLFLDLLTFNNAGAQLFVRGWHEFEDFLLIKKTAYAVGQ